MPAVDTVYGFLVTRFSSMISSALADITEFRMGMSHVCLYVAHRNVLIRVSSVASALTPGQGVRWIDGSCYLDVSCGFQRHFLQRTLCEILFMKLGFRGQVVMLLCTSLLHSKFTT